MREPKYRAWHDGLMYRVYKIEFSETGISFIHMINEQEKALFHTDNPDAYTLMDYIGHKDCNGVEIYDSDIVSIAHTSMLITPGTIGVVSYSSGRYIVETHTHTHGLNLFVDRRYRRYAKPYIEIVGNLYETPQLAPKK